eukprot:TRINITY_DN2519_c0_g1_i1.p1 TRINITY_DN2519_c0_g1~~TRINITY_DN2519_c0_g1_i1.p1  ORF type:complete len:227 (-),score=101.56 TRINITY_DN2519_c0_g1_i1:211-891(-)
MSTGLSFGSLFAKKKEAPKLNESIGVLRESILQLEKREAFLQKQADEALAKAKVKSKKGDKKGALFELKRKKMFEQQIESMFGKRVNLETQIMALQSAAANKDVLEAMKKGKEAIQKHINDKVVDEVADVMDDINEGISLVQEMDEALSQPVGNDLLDDDELENELNELENEFDEIHIEDGFDQVPAVMHKKKPMSHQQDKKQKEEPVISREEEEELAELEAALLS